MAPLKCKKHAWHVFIHDSRPARPFGPILCLTLFLVITGAFTNLQAQGRAKKQDTSGASAGIRLAAFTPTGDLGKSLSSGTGINLYYDQPFEFFLSGKLPSYMPASLQAMLNYESLSGEEEEGAQKGYKNSLSRTGLELGFTWSFLLAPKHRLGLLLLGGFASEKAEQEAPDTSASDAETLPPLMEQSETVFSSHLIINYEYHYSDFVFSAGSYTVYGADEERPLIGTGFNLGFGYKF